VDTKYEFGKTKDGVIVLIDEIHARFFSLFLFRRISGRQDKGEEQKQLSKNLYAVG
jgi:phosphoribosylaminoimidazole-succinocarboxamide synthase